MNIKISNTDKIVLLKRGNKCKSGKCNTVNINDGIPARIWEGETDTGIKVICFVTRIAVSAHEDTEQFNKELKECKEQSDAARSIPLRIII